MLDVNTTAQMLSMHISFVRCIDRLLGEAQFCSRALARRQGSSNRTAAEYDSPVWASCTMKAWIDREDSVRQRELWLTAPAWPDLSYKSPQSRSMRSIAPILIEPVFVASQTVLTWFVSRDVSAHLHLLTIGTALTDRWTLEINQFTMR